MPDNIGLFIGTDRGLSVLKTLIDQKRHIKNVLVLNQREHEINNCTYKIIDLCKKNNIGFKTSKEVKPQDYEEYLKKQKFDVLFVISWRFLISDACFSLTKKGIFVIHDSLLPKYRGFAPTNWVIINQEKKTGATLFYIDQEVDAGDIVDQIQIEIGKDETAKTLNDKFLKVYPQLIERNLDNILLGKNKRIPQDHSKATFSSQRKPEDGHINFAQPTDKIVSFIRGLTYPYPGAFCYFDDEKIIVWEAQKASGNHKERAPGEVMDVEDGFVDVTTIDGVLRISRISRHDDPGKFLKPKDLIKNHSVQLV